MLPIKITHLSVLLSTLLAQSVDAQQHTYRAMSFNIRFGTADDGDNRWPLRKELVVQTIQRFDPDLIGLQEVMPFQAAYLTRELEVYDYVGKVRDHNQDSSEQCGILFRRDRFVDLAQGHFWLSETPDVPASKSWDSSLPRMVTWVKLFDRRTSRLIYVFNTHFDHQGEDARRQSAGLLLERMGQIADSAPVIVTGDFNCAEDSDPYRVLITHNETEVQLVDTWRAHRPSRQAAEGTFNGFEGRKNGSRIDWILVSPELQVVSASIVRDHQDTRYPSDHFPVTAVLQR